MVNTCPFRLLTLEGWAGSSMAQFLQKLALQQQSSASSPVGLHVSPLSQVPFKHQTMRLTAWACNSLGSEENLAHWFTAQVMSGRACCWRCWSIPMIEAQCQSSLCFSPRDLVRWGSVPWACCSGCSLPIRRHRLFCRSGPFVSLQMFRPGNFQSGFQGGLLGILHR
jgi:hypothetical protein